MTPTEAQGDPTYEGRKSTSSSRIAPTESSNVIGAEKIRDNLAKAIRACIDNAQRLQAETYDLEFRTPSATRYFLLIIAQEEAAKAFVLYLIKERIVPLTSAVRRAINDHACKHLVGMIMEYMIVKSLATATPFSRPIATL